jgi:spore maturation protein B
MNTVFSLLPVLIIAGVGIYALLRGVDVFAALTDGASEGLKTVARILPALICPSARHPHARASGAVDALAQVLSPVLAALGLPAEIVPSCSCAR